MFLFWTSLLLSPFAIAYRRCPPTIFCSIWAFFWALFSWACLRADFFNRARTCAAPHPCHSSGILHIELNLIGLGIGIGGGIRDYMTAQGHGEPIVTLLAFTVLSMLAIPLMYVAGKRFHADRARLFEAGAQRNSHLHTKPTC